MNQLGMSLPPAALCALCKLACAVDLPAVHDVVHLATRADPPAAKTCFRRELYSGVTTVRDRARDVRLPAEPARPPSKSTHIFPPPPSGRSPPKHIDSTCGSGRTQPFFLLFRGRSAGTDDDAAYKPAAETDFPQAR